MKNRDRHETHRHFRAFDADSIIRLSCLAKTVANETRQRHEQRHPSAKSLLLPHRHHPARPTERGLEKGAFTRTLPCCKTWRDRTRIYRQILELRRDWHLLLRRLWQRAVPFRLQVRQHLRLAKLFRAGTPRQRHLSRRHLLRHDPHRSALRTLRRSPRPPLR